MTLAAPTAEDIKKAATRLEERTCRVGSPRGPIGIVERVYRGRKTIAIKCKVLMESGAVRYVDEADVYAN